MLALPTLNLPPIAERNPPAASIGRRAPKLPEHFLPQHFCLAIDVGILWTSRGKVADRLCTDKDQKWNSLLDRAVFRNVCKKSTEHRRWIVHPGLLITHFSTNPQRSSQQQALRKIILLEKQL